MANNIALGETNLLFQLNKKQDKEYLKQKMYIIWSAIQSRDIMLAADIIASLESFDLAMLGMSHYLEELNRIRKEEKVRAQNIEAVTGPVKQGKETILSVEVLNKYRAEKEKITEEIENTLVKISYQAGVAKQQQREYDAMYDRLIAEYGRHPQESVVVKKILDIEALRLRCNEEAIKSMNKEQKHLTKQAGRLSKLHQKMTVELLSEKVASQIIKIETAKFLAGLEQEISQVALVVSEVAAAVRQFEALKKQAELRTKQLEGRAVDQRLSCIVGEFVANIITAEDKRRHASFHEERRLPPHKMIINSALRADESVKKEGSRRR